MSKGVRSFTCRWVVSNQEGFRGGSSPLILSRARVVTALAQLPCIQIDNVRTPCPAATEAVVLKSWCDSAILLFPSEPSQC